MIIYIYLPAIPYKILSANYCVLNYVIVWLFNMNVLDQKQLSMESMKISRVGDNEFEVRKTASQCEAPS